MAEIPPLQPPWARIALVRDDTSLFADETMDALDEHYAPEFAGKADAVATATALASKADATTTTAALATKADATTTTAALATKADATATTAALGTKADAATVYSKLASDARYTTPRLATVASRGATGMVCMIFDDGLSDHLAVAQLLEDRDMRATFAVNPSRFGNAGRLTAAQVADLSARGHEIANHTWDHVDMTTQTPAERAAAMDDATASILSVTGKSPTTLVYPLNKTNQAIDSNAYLRFLRAFTGNLTPFMEQLDDRGAFLHGRFSWSADSTSVHQRAMAAVARCVRENIVMTIFTHNVGETAVSGGISTAMLVEFLDFCVANKIQVVPANVAFPAFTPLSDAGYDAQDARFLSITGLNATNTYSKPNTATVPPAAGMPGTRVLRLTGDGTATIRAMHADYIPISSGETLTISAQLQQARTSGGGSALVVQEFDAYGTQIGADIVGTTYSTTFTWQQVTMDYTPSATARQIRIGHRQVSMVGTTDIDHMHIDVKRRPALG